ncbi:WD repeat-containing protein 34 [Carassius gibelio]|uniref:WD repeat-containing protein 34 n=1 Tax=Carassius gibelio TaxID=101364 RepID=UPI002278C28E|nr:WD repeat-containing protein 34 [Carassius gibelio]
MFTDETLALIGAESTWRKSHQQTQESRSCQTLPVHTSQRCVRQQHPDRRPDQSNTPPRTKHLSVSWCLHFLNRAEDVVTKELVKSSKNHAFDGFEVNCEDQNRSRCPICAVFSVLMLWKGAFKSAVCPGTAPVRS